MNWLPQEKSLGPRKGLALLGRAAWKALGQELTGGKPGDLGSGAISCLLGLSNLLPAVLHTRTPGRPHGQGAAGTSVQLQVPLGFSAAVFGPECPFVSSLIQTLVMRPASLAGWEISAIYSSSLIMHLLR